MLPDETSSPAKAGEGAEAKEHAPVSTAPASKSNKGKAAKGPKAKKDFGEIRINDTTVIKYDKVGSKAMNLPKPRETPKTVG